MLELGQKWMYSGKVIVFGRGGCIRAKWLYLDKSGCIRVTVIVKRQKLLYSVKVVEFGQKWFYSEKSGCIGC